MMDLQVQYIVNDRGKRTSAIVPIELFNKLINDSNLDEFYEAIQDETGPSDNVKYPNDVINIFSSKGCTMQAAWRFYRGLTQKQVAEKLGITQASVSEFEKSERPRKDNLLRLAELYNCTPEQLTLE